MKVSDTTASLQRILIFFSYIKKKRGPKFCLPANSQKEIWGACRESALDVELSDYH